MASAVRKSKMKEVPLSCLAFCERPRLVTANQLAYSSGLNQRTTGSTTDWKTIHGFCNGLSKLGQASVRAEASSWKTSSSSAL